jgi:hypothetical protein
VKRSVVGIVIILVGLMASAPVASATTIWTARISGHGAATIRPGSPSKLSIGLTSFRAGSTYTITIRKGSCGSLGTLVLSTRLTASVTGRLTRTITMTSAQTRAAKLPLAIRVGTRWCAVFKAPTVLTGFPDGIYAVGTVTGAVRPGTYRAAGSETCTWARLLALSNMEVLANRSGTGPSVVTINPTDGAFQSSGCGTWVLNAPAVPTTNPGPGVWRVGVDIQPGTYQSSGGESCYWARLYSFQGNSQLESNVVSGPTTVKVLSTDMGFESNRCGTWTKVG